MTDLGLSPHLRGNPGESRFAGPCGGSIPALAGEPLRPIRGTRQARVYPRTCGGTYDRDAPRQLLEGLSPHLRGNHGDHHAQVAPGGSIPALAGEPLRSPRIGSYPWVYPRTCGGTRPKSWSTVGARGLSPHLRGNLFAGKEGGHGRGSIPALAGEPFWVGFTPRSRRVYPRTCGGTLERIFQNTSNTGLSPHLRGNHERVDRQALKAGSIPALAGEPPP